MSILIGLTGENCSGKGTVAESLKKKGFAVVSLSDVVREELAREGKKVTRDALIQKANALREQFGPGILAQKISIHIDPNRNHVIDSIRNPAEVEELKKQKNFFLFYITAPAELRFERMQARKRESDPHTFEAFLHLEQLEAKGKSTSQNLVATARLADKNIENDGNFSRLYDRLDAVLAELSGDFRLVRPSWDDYFMNIAKVVSSRSNCIKRKVAAVIVKDRRIVSTGYNGTPRGVKNCSDGGCARCNRFEESGKNLSECVCSHGEENAIVQASYHGIPIQGTTLYCTYSSCLLCAKMIINAGIAEVVYNEDYPLPELSHRLFQEAGVKMRKHKV